MMKKILIQLLVGPIFVFFGSSLVAEKKVAQKPSNNKDYCVICHEQQAKASLRKPVDEWRSGVHGLNGKACNICHGGNSGTIDKIRAKSKLANFVGRPDKKKIAELCGREGCHAASLEQFKQGPHYQSVHRTGEPGCTTCHGVHNIQRSSIGIIRAESCTACHSPKYSKEIIDLITRHDRGIGKIDKNVAFLSEEHVDIKGFQDRLKRVRQLFNRYVHILSRQDMDSAKNILEMEIAGLDNESRSKVTSIQRIDMLYNIMVIFCLAVIVGFLIYIIAMYSKRKK